MMTHAASAPRLLPPDDAERLVLHNEVHARPSARIRLPALVVLLAVANDGVSRGQECEHLRRLPGQEGLSVEALQGNFLSLRLPQCTLKWERHTEFTRYTLVQALPPGAGLGAAEPDILSNLALPEGWLAQVPGRTFARSRWRCSPATLPTPWPASSRRGPGSAVRWWWLR